MTGPVLVTGAAGLLGAAVCRQLAEQDVPFTPVWHNVAPPFEGGHRADLSVAGALDDVGAAEAIVHAAALLPASFEDCAEEAATNRRIDEHVLAAAQRLRAPVVYASTISLYAPGTGAALDEAAPLQPWGPYQEEKARGERAGIAWAARTGLAFTALRVSAPYGPGQRTRTVIQLFVERALAGGPLEYFGSGSREQDFTWADDAAEACVRALGGPSGAFNVTGGRPVTMRELAAVVADAAGLDPSAVRAAGRPDPQEGTLARYDVTAARRHLGWAPRTTLRAGIDQLLAERLERVR